MPRVSRTGRGLICPRKGCKTAMRVRSSKPSPSGKSIYRQRCCPCCGLRIGSREIIGGYDELAAQLDPYDPARHSPAVQKGLTKSSKLKTDPNDDDLVVIDVPVPAGRFNSITQTVDVVGGRVVSARVTFEK